LILEDSTTASAGPTVNDQSAEQTQLLQRRGTDISIITVAGVAHGVSHFFHLLIPPLFPWLMPAFALNYTEVGSAVTVFFVISGIGQALAGLLVDRFGSLRLLFAAMLCFIGACLLLGTAQGFVGLSLAAALAGAGNSIFHPADFSLLNHRVSSARLSHAFAMHGLGGYIGWAIAPLFLTGIASVAGWRTAAFMAGGVALAALVMLWAARHLLSGNRSHIADQGVQADKGGAENSSQNIKTRVTTLEILRSGAVWICFLYFFMTTVSFGAMQNYLPTILQGLHDMVLAVAAGSLSAYMAGGAVGMVLGGFLVRRISQEKLISFALLSSASCTLLLIAGDNWPQFGIVALVALAGMLLGVTGPARDMMVRQSALKQMGSSAYGRVYGFVYSGLDVGLALSPLAFGFLMNQQLWSAALTGIAAVMALSVATAWRAGSK